MQKNILFLALCAEPVYEIISVNGISSGSFSLKSRHCLEISMLSHFLITQQRDFEGKQIIRNGEISCVNKKEVLSMSKRHTVCRSGASGSKYIGERDLCGDEERSVFPDCVQAVSV